MSLSPSFLGVRAIFFDIDDTLLDFHSCASLALDSAFSSVGLVYREEYFSTFQEINDVLWKRIEEQTLTHAELHGIRFRLIFKALGLAGDFARAEEEFRAYLRTAAVPVKGAHEVLEALNAAGYRLFCASNASHKEQGNRLKKAGLLPYIEEVFVSSDIGAPKPSREFFSACLARAGLTAGECVMIGDNLFADVGGAINVGMRTVWLNSTGTSLSGGISPDAVVSSLLEVKSLLLPEKA